MEILFRILKINTFLMTVLFTSVAIGGDFEIVDITNEEDNEITRFILNTDNENEEISGFTYLTISSSGRVLKTVKKSYQGLFSKIGIVIEKRKDRNIVIFRSDNFAGRHNGGNIIVDTLYNGATGKRKNYDFELVRAGSKWEILYKHVPISKIHLKSNKLPFIGTVGISDLVAK